MKRAVRASEIYAKQNKALHGLFRALGRPYREHKDFWCGIFSDVLGKRVSGLSELTLGERDLIIKHFQETLPEMEIRNPAVPKRLRGWKKGMPEASYRARREADPQLRMIFALWAELGYEPHQLRELLRRMFKVEEVRWLDEEQRRRLVNFLRHKLAQKDRGVHYYPEV